MKRVTDHGHAGHYHGTAFDHVVLAHDERHLRRKVLTLSRGEQILVDLPDAIAFGHGDVLILEDGRMAEIIAANESLYEITPRGRQHLTELAWHLGNRHLPAQLEENRIVILRDHVIKGMLEGLGAKVIEITAPFHPLRGAYHSGHGHSHGHDDHEHHHHHADD
jgi:urease accessory protein